MCLSFVCADRCSRDRTALGRPCLVARRGAEVCVSFTALYALRSERRRDLRLNFGFHCVCARCGPDDGADGAAGSSASNPLDAAPPLLQTAPDAGLDPVGARTFRDKLLLLQRAHRAIAKHYARECAEQLQEGRRAGDQAADAEDEEDDADAVALAQRTGPLVVAPPQPSVRPVQHNKSLAAAQLFLREANGVYAPLHPQYFQVCNSEQANERQKRTDGTGVSYLRRGSLERTRTRNRSSSSRRARWRKWARMPNRCSSSSGHWP